MEDIRPQHQRRCIRCGETFDLSFFRRAHSQLQVRDTHHRVCRGCEQTSRDTAKQANRPRVKARGALRTHAARYRRKGLNLTDREFAERFGWCIDTMAHDIEYQAGNGCPYCRKQFSSMAHGLADVTLDIIDPSKLPYYRPNVRWVCSTCNKAKGATPPEEWGRMLESWAKWERRQQGAATPPDRHGTPGMF